MYRTRLCAYCVLAKTLLARRGIAFDEVDVSGDRAARARLLQETGRRTVPQIYVDGRPIGGFRELYELDRRGALEPLLSQS
jgi:glutaredoxin 3